MPTAGAYTNKIRFAGSVRNTKAQLPGNVGNLSQQSIAGCGLNIDYTPRLYVENTKCACPPPLPPKLYIKTIAGNGAFGFSGDGALATAGQLYYPSGVCVDSAGNVYIADTYNHRIRKVDTAGYITTIAGTGVLGYNGDDIDATLAQLYYPYGVCVDSADNVYIADTFNNRIRRVDTAGYITTIVGTGGYGYNGESIAATLAWLRFPRTVCLDSVGNMYIADNSNHRIRKVDTAGIITTIAGTGVQGNSGDRTLATLAQLNSPFGVFVDSGFNVYIAENGGERIRKVDTAGYITTVAGNGTYGYSGDWIAATSARLNSARGVAVDSAGNVYIADTFNNRVRKVDATTKIITTIAGTGSRGYNGDGIPANTASVDTPFGVFVDSGGNVYIADTYNKRIRKLYYA